MEASELQHSIAGHQHRENKCRHRHSSIHRLSPVLDEKNYQTATPYLFWYLTGSGNVNFFNSGTRLTECQKVSLLVSAHNPLPSATVHWPLSTVLCPLPTAYCPLNTTYYPLYSVPRLLPIALSTLHCLLSNACLLFIVTIHCQLLTAHCLLFTVYCNCPLSTALCPQSNVHPAWCIYVASWVP